MNEANYQHATNVNRLCKTWTAVNESRLIVVHVLILLPIKNTQKIFSPVRYGEAMFQIL